MKKLNTLLATVLFGLLAFSFTSCDDDDSIAYTLEGTWQGNMYVTYDYGGYSYDASYSELCFLRDPYRYASGEGYWVDYYSNAPWDYYANDILWEVHNGVITIHFVQDGGTVDIYDYRLNDNIFSGYILDSYSGERLNFHLRHVDSPNWDDYRYGYYYDDYWANQSAFDAGETTRATDRQQTKPVRRFGKR